MRMQNWAMALMSLLGPLVVCSTTLAQGYPAIPGGGYVDSGGYPNPYLTQTPMNPGVFEAQFNTPGPQGGPPGAMPYPAISPHLGPNVMQSQTFQQDGAWVNRIIGRKRQWYFTTEYLHTDFPGPGGNRIGSPIAEIDRATGESPVPNFWERTLPLSGPPVAADGGGDGEVFNQIWTGPGAWPLVVQRIDLTTELLTVEPDLNTVLPIVRSTNLLDDVMSSNGLRFRGGYFDNDGTGIGAEVWWGFTANDSVQFGDDEYNGLPITQNMIAGFDIEAFAGTGTLFELDPGQATFLMNARVGYLPLIDGTNLWNEGGLFPGTAFTGLTGTTTRYDLMYRIATHVNAGGGNVNFYMGDVYRRPHASIKSFVAAKYMFIDDRFGFRGLDSGFGYEIDFASGGTGGGTTTGAATFSPVDGAINGPYYPLFESILNSTVESHLAGPEIGLRGDLGKTGGTFSAWWVGSFGLLANHEKARVQGNNIGNPYYFNENYYGFLSPEYDMFANDTSFNDVEQHTVVSPIINLGINAQLGIFDTIPGLRKISLFDDATLNVGYNMTFIGNVASAADSIRWRGFPDEPSAQIDRRWFNMQQLSIGLQFAR